MWALKLNFNLLDTALTSSQGTSAEKCCRDTYCKPVLYLYSLSFSVSAPPDPNTTLAAIIITISALLYAKWAAEVVALSSEITTETNQMIDVIDPEALVGVFGLLEDEISGDTREFKHKKNMEGLPKPFTEQIHTILLYRRHEGYHPPLSSRRWVNLK